MARAKNDPLLLGAALAIQPALIVLQTFVSVVFHAAFPHAFAVAFFGADIALTVALVLLARSERDRAPAAGTALLVAFVALASLVTVVSPTGKAAVIARIFSGASSAVAFVSALAIFAIVASLARAAGTPGRVVASLVFVTLTCIVIVTRVLRLVSGEGRSIQGAWLDLVLDLVRVAIPIALAIATSRKVTRVASQPDEEGSPYRSAPIAETPPPPVELAAQTLPAWRDALGGLRILRRMLFVRIGFGVVFVVLATLLVASTSAARAPGMPAYVVPLASLVGGIVTLLGYLRARPLGQVVEARPAWLVAQLSWAFVVAVDVLTLMFGLDATLGKGATELADTIAIVGLPSAMTLLLELVAATSTARALRRVGESLRDEWVVRRAGWVLGFGIVAVGAFFAALSGVWVDIDMLDQDVGATFAIALGLVALAASGATFAALALLAKSVRASLERSIAAAG